MNDNNKQNISNQNTGNQNTGSRNTGNLQADANPGNGGLLNTLRPLGNLWPAAVVAGVVMISLPMTAPVLEEVPERLAEIAEEVTGDDTVQAEEIGEEEAQAVGDYEDGVYTGSAQGYGGPVKVKVTVENRQITSVDIVSSSGETPKFFKRAEKVIDSVLLKQTWEVDTVSGATYSSKGILGAIQNAITGETVTNAAPKKTTPKKTASIVFEEPSGYQDGTYYGSAQGFGGTIKVCVTITDGKIASVELVSASGETSSYLNKAKSILKTIVSKQSPNVDTVSGATYSSKGIINAAKKALSQAAVDGSSDTEETEDPSTDTETDITIPADKFLNGNYTDGSYEGTAEGFGGDVTMRVTISGNQITAIETVSAEDETPLFFDQATGVISEMLSEQTTDVDAVSGATYSSNGIIGAVKDAVSQAEVKDENDPADDETGDSDNTDDPSGEGTGDSGNTDDPSGDSGNTDDPTGGESGEGSDDSGDTDEDTQDEPVGLYVDGDYLKTITVVPDEDEDFEAYDVTLSMTVSGGDITVLEFAEDNTFGDNKTNSRLSAKALAGIAPSLLETQTTEGIDAVSGATCSSNAILSGTQELLSEILRPVSEEGSEEDAEESGETGESGESGESDASGESGESDASGESGNNGGSEGTGTSGKSGNDGTGTDTEGTGDQGNTGNQGNTGGSGSADGTGTAAKTLLYNEGTFTGSAVVEPDEDEDFTSYSILVQIAIKNDQISSIGFTDDNTFGNVKTNKRLSTAALNGMSDAIISTGSTNVDSVSGATCSSKAIKEAIENALKAARIIRTGEDR